MEVLCIRGLAISWKKFATHSTILPRRSLFPGKTRLRNVLTGMLNPTHSLTLTHVAMHAVAGHWLVSSHLQYRTADLLHSDREWPWEYKGGEGWQTGSNCIEPCDIVDCKHAVKLSWPIVNWSASCSSQMPRLQLVLQQVFAVDDVAGWSVSC